MHWDNPEGWDREGGRFRTRGHMYTMADFTHSIPNPESYILEEQSRVRGFHRGGQWKTKVGTDRAQIVASEPGREVGSQRYGQERRHAQF